MIDALLSLGGNVGDRKAAVDAAIAALGALPGTAVTARSAYYRTVPDGPVAQPWFVNLAVAVRSEMTPAALAAACKEIETALGRDRTREIPWGPRPIDIDVVATGDSREMTPPGDSLDARPFVLVPMAEIAGFIVIAGYTIAQRAEAAGSAGVEQLSWPFA